MSAHFILKYIIIRYKILFPILPLGMNGLTPIPPVYVSNDPHIQRYTGELAYYIGIMVAYEGNLQGLDLIT